MGLVRLSQVPHGSLIRARAAAMVEDGPSSFLCPILQEVMRDPVCTADGHTYERSAIVHWLRAHPLRPTSPLTGLVLPHPGLTPNHALRAAIEEACAGAAGARPPPSPRAQELHEQRRMETLHAAGDAAQRAAAERDSSGSLSRALASVLAAAAERGSVALVAAVRGHSASADPSGLELTAPACGAVARLARTSRRRSLLSHGAVAALVHALRARSSDATVVKNACFALASLIGGDAFDPLSGIEDVADVLVAALMQHMAHSDIVTAAAAALANACAVGRGACVRAGAASALACALASHGPACAAAASTLAQACANIVAATSSTPLCSADDAAQQASATQAMVEGDAVRCALACMCAHPGDAAVQIGMSRLLRNLMQHREDTRSALGGCSGYEVLARTLRGHAQEAAVVEAALQALANALCGAGDAAAAGAMRAGVMEATCAAVSMHGSHGGVQLAAAATLTRLISAAAAGSARALPQLQQRASACGLIAALRCSMQALPTDMKVQAATALRHVASRLG